MNLFLRVILCTAERSFTFSTSEVEESAVGGEIEISKMAKIIRNGMVFQKR